ncbi:MAG: cyclic nucleotide-binding domain-containing protein [Pseudomonadota bacterium]
MSPVYWIDAAGFLACALVFGTFCMKTLLPLRLLAVASNVAFIVYGVLAGLIPILVLHSMLLPLNLWRTVEHIIRYRRMGATARAQTEVTTLIPFMRRIQRSEGTQLFAKGDHADTIYYITEGEVLIPEINKTLQEGTLFGEIGPFTPEGIRTASARCATDCILHVISDQDIRKICLDEPSFGLYLTKLIAARMAENQTTQVNRSHAEGQASPEDSACSRAAMRRA